MTLVKYFFSLSVSVCLVSCNESDPRSKYSDLYDRIAQYYQLEKDKNWHAAYEYRTPTFRNSVSRDRYVAIMDSDSANWRLARFTLKNIYEKNSKVYALIEFVERREGDNAGMSKAITVEEESIWLKIGDQWYSYAPASRMYLSLNEALVVE